MKRRENWPALLVRFIESRRSVAFEWGKYDCTLFAADAIEAITGVDLADGYRGTYSSQKAALRLIKKAGDLSGYAQLPEVPVQLMQRGDAALIDTPGGRAFAICLGRQLAAQGPDGVAFFPASKALRAWKVGA